MTTETERDPKFNTAAGWLTPYALMCGYVELFETGIRYTSAEVVYENKPLTGRRVSLFAEGCYHVRAFDFDKSEQICWDTFATLADARRAYTKVKRAISVSA